MSLPDGQRGGYMVGSGSSLIHAPDDAQHGVLRTDFQRRDIPKAFRQPCLGTRRFLVLCHTDKSRVCAHPATVAPGSNLSPSYQQADAGEGCEQYERPTSLKDIF